VRPHKNCEILYTFLELYVQETLSFLLLIPIEAILASMLVGILRPKYTIHNYYTTPESSQGKKKLTLLLSNPRLSITK
jgi:hypothetical protein